MIFWARSYLLGHSSLERKVSDLQNMPTEASIAPCKAVAQGEYVLGYMPYRIAAIQGMSPTTATHLCSKAGLSPAATANELADTQWRALFSEWLSWLRAVETSSFSPTVREDGSVSAVGAHSIPVQMLRAVDEYYRMPQVCGLFDFTW